MCDGSPVHRVRVPDREQQQDISDHEGDGTILFMDSSDVSNSNNAGLLLFCNDRRSVMIRLLMIVNYLAPGSLIVKIHLTIKARLWS